MNACLVQQKKENCACVSPFPHFFVSLLNQTLFQLQQMTNYIVPIQVLIFFIPTFHDNNYICVFSMFIKKNALMKIICQLEDFIIKTKTKKKLQGASLVVLVGSFELNSNSNSRNALN